MGQVNTAEGRSNQSNDTAPITSGESRPSGRRRKFAIIIAGLGLLGANIACNLDGGGDGGRGGGGVIKKDPYGDYLSCYADCGSNEQKYKGFGGDQCRRTCDTDFRKAK